ncbi:NADH-quinone oxidoreductase subunit B family protein [Natronobacterium gregoryi]|uniref:Coenzyme F420-reducing hydrogenase, gamma subunit n=2 Tax=Natronobacterium gregoryi TaxID=44930 RepID=L0AJC7_NATGS|nr:NADH ubiquinone dehydrogenase [Natronobacterium gregoryi]AFZ74003.1 coenzyme F420-reducing hydrogenase, gamma subunit [Natronobacterium gregoryi SP2]ELY70575.1 NADH ubiquinone oxidoreductase 20 kDa subunit [Natronobacterium gregoryi SP2]PLK20752.1 NADH:ubiquinone oxidoreductase [Natronobacterium gregoryi SP2]SFJ08003.1 F420-non-reducing hydrogenase subunit G [Natronobacterium gregoryi]
MATELDRSDRGLAEYVDERLAQLDDPPAAPLTLGIYWTGSCGGCDANVADLGEALLALSSHVDVAIWPLATDFKPADVERLETDEIDICLFNGAIRLDDHEEMAHLLRDRSRTLVAYGACAHLGGIPGLAEFSSPDDLVRTKYEDVPTVTGGESPRGETDVESGRLELPTLRDGVDRLEDVVDVEYTVPGCPPSRRFTADLLLSALEEDLPEPGTVLAGDGHVCRECPREVDERHLESLERVHEVEPADGECLLNEGLVCLGPLTAAGCNARCLEANVPCRGCFGPAESTCDVGAQLASSLGPLVEPDGDDEVAAIVDEVEDWAGLTHYFTLADSPLGQVQDPAVDDDRGDRDE